MKKLYLAVAAAIVVLISYFAFSQYENSRQIELISSHVINTSLRVANATKYETEADTKISYKELFAKMEVDILEMDKHLLAIQTISSSKTEKYTGPAIIYLKASQAYMRALLQKFRKQLELVDRATRVIESALGRAGLETLPPNVVQQANDLKKSMAKIVLLEAGPELRSAAQKLKEARIGLNSILPTNSLVPIELLDAVIENNSKSQ